MIFLALAASSLVVAGACTSTDGSEDSGGAGTTSNGGKGGSGGSSSAGTTSSSAGSAGTSSAGTGGSSGGTAGPSVCDGMTGSATGDCRLIDDLEDGDGKVLMLEDRGGVWYATNDGTGSDVTPEAGNLTGGEAGGHEGLGVHTTGSGLSNYGGGVGFGIGGKCYDAGIYDGISFWAKGPGTIRVTVSTADTQKTMYGGDCGDGPNCGDGFGTKVELTGAWAEYSVKWTDLEQAGWGKAVTFDAGRILGMDFFAAADDAGTYTWDFWLDDIAFTGGSGGDQCDVGAGGTGSGNGGSGNEPSAGAGGS